jgi:hypothetical protein
MSVSSTHRPSHAVNKSTRLESQTTLRLVPQKYLESRMTLQSALDDNSFSSGLCQNCFALPTLTCDDNARTFWKRI